MHLWLHGPDSEFFVRRCGAAAVTVGERELTRSFILARDALVEDWQATDVLALAEADLAPILRLEPEVVLLGSGNSLRFPSQQLRAAFLARGIGLEVMDNAAAARTFNVLASEGRKVVAAFILATP